MSDVLSFEQECKILNEKIVNGFVRTHVMTNNHIPNEIIDLCFKYYHDLPERFNIIKCHKGIILSNDGLTATRQSTTYYDYPIVYGTVGINSKDRCKYQWTLTITKRVSDSLIGISTKDKTDKIENLQLFEKNYPNYSYQTCSDRKWKLGKHKSGYGTPMDSGQQIIMIVDFKLKQISFISNGKDLGIAYDDIKIGPIYYLAVSLHVNGECITIDRFECIE